MISGVWVVYAANRAMSTTSSYDFFSIFLNDPLNREGLNLFCISPRRKVRKFGESFIIINVLPQLALISFLFMENVP